MTCRNLSEFSEIVFHDLKYLSMATATYRRGTKWKIKSSQILHTRVIQL